MYGNCFGTDTDIAYITLYNGKFTITRNIVSGYNIKDLYAHTTNSDTEIIFITEDGKLFKYLSSNGKTSLLNDEHRWTKFGCKLPEFSVISEDGYIFYYKDGKTPIVSTENGYDTNTSNVKIKNKIVYNIESDNPSVAFDYKYDNIVSVYAPYARSKGFCALRYIPIEEQG